MLCQKFQVSPEDTWVQLVEQFSISEEEAQTYLAEFWVKEA